MEKKLFDELVLSLRQAIAVGRASGRKRRARRQVAERIREEREAQRMISPRAFKQKRPLPKYIRVRTRSKRVVKRREVRG